MVITRLHCAGKSFRRYRNFSIRTSYVLQSPKRRGGHRLPLLFLSPFSACPMYAAPERRASPLIQRFLRAAHFARFLNQKPFTLTGGTGSSIQKPHGGIARPEAVCFACFLEQKPFTLTGRTGSSIQKPHGGIALPEAASCFGERFGVIPFYTCGTSSGEAGPSGRNSPLPLRSGPSGFYFSAQARSL